MGLAPNPSFPEQPTYTYERSMAANRPGNRGPLRFEEGVATDTDVPDDFQQGISDGVPGPRGRNRNVYEKPAEQTTKERAHVGSASWVEAPSFLGEFAYGADTRRYELTYDEVTRSGGPVTRHNPVTVEG